MHELSVTENILNIAVQHAKQNSASRVTDVYLVIGRLSSIIDDSVQFYWDMVTENTLCAGSTLHFERIPAKLACRSCQTEYEIASEMTPCPACGSANVAVISGDQFFLESIEIEK